MADTIATTAVCDNCHKSGPATRYEGEDRDGVVVTRDGNYCVDCGPVSDPGDCGDEYD